MAQQEFILFYNGPFSQWYSSPFNATTLFPMKISHDEKNLADYLKNSGQKIFVEASPYDKIWGIGMDASHPDACTPAKWKGLNLLGKSITTVRNKLFPPK